MPVVALDVASENECCKRRGVTGAGGVVLGCRPSGVTGACGGLVSGKRCGVTAAAEGVHICRRSGVVAAMAHNVGYSQRPVAWMLSKYYMQPIVINACVNIYIYIDTHMHIYVNIHIRK